MENLFNVLPNIHILKINHEYYSTIINAKKNKNNRNPIFEFKRGYFPYKYNHHN